MNLQNLNKQDRPRFLTTSIIFVSSRKILRLIRQGFITSSSDMIDGDLLWRRCECKALGIPISKGIALHRALIRTSFMT